MTDLALIDSTLEVSDRIATLTFRRDDVRNALTGTQLVDDILKVVDWANRSNAVSALILTGEGAAFSSGGNVKDMAEKRGMFAGSVLELQDNYRRGIQRLPLAMQKAEIPVIAAINGAAIGVGFDLACMCDLRIASATARMGETFVSLGIIPGDGGAWFLQRLIGYQRAFELTLTGRVIDAEEGKDIGLLLEVVEPEHLLACARQLASRIALQPPLAVRMTKRLMARAQREDDLESFLDICACFQGMAHHTAEHETAVGEYVSRMNSRRRDEK